LQNRRPLAAVEKILQPDRYLDCRSASFL
jgi:hypothetical protein